MADVEGGILTKDQINQLRRTRVGEQWERIDSVVIGKGASGAGGSKGWFETWKDFAETDELVWFQGRDTGAPKSLVNQLGERTDWAQTIHQTLVEFVAPVGISDIESDPNDGFVTPQIFVQQLANFMPMRLIISEADEMTNAPGSHYPSGFGTSYPLQAGAAAPSTYAGQQGEPLITQGWKWPEPLGLAAKSNIAVKARIDNPLRKFFAGLPGPGVKEVPDGDGGIVELPNWYYIRITHRGPRWLQIRGARESA